MKSHSSHAFSLTELLVALAVFALVAAIIIPRYVNIQSQAQDAVAQQMAGQLNSVYADWKASGGTIIPTPNASLLLYVLSGQGDPIPAAGVTYNGTTVTEAGTASSIRIGLPAGTVIDPTLASNVVTTGGPNPVFIAYSSGSDSFAAIPVASITWQSGVGVAPYTTTGNSLPQTTTIPGSVSFGTLNSGSKLNTWSSSWQYGFDGTSYYKAACQWESEYHSPKYVVTWIFSVYKGVKVH